MSVMKKLALSGVVVVLAVPGLIIEPGPVSEVVALSLLVAIWVGDEEVKASDVTDKAGGG